MRSIWMILTFLLSGLSVWAQPPGPPEEDGPPDPKLPERMSQFIQTNLEMTPAEREKFNPVFKRYMKDFAKVHRENRGDRLVMQQQAIELRLKYRKEFRQLFDEKRADRIFMEEDRFRHEVIKMIRDRRKQRGGPPPPGGRRRFQ
ncbi:MAG: hypothetical protein ACKO6Q_01975 [Bacteroidota bacterium]